MTHYEVIKLFNGYLVIYIRPYFIVLYYILSRGVALYCTCTAAFVVFMYDASVHCLPFRIISTEHSIITQAASQ